MSRARSLTSVAPAFLLFLSFCAAWAGSAGSGEQSSRPDLWVDRPLLRVEVLGLRHTQAAVIDRELSASPGTPLDWARLECDRLRLLNHGIFASLEMQARRDPESDRPVLWIEVEERPSFLILPTLDYDPEQGFLYGGEASTINLGGRAQRAGLSGRWGGARHLSAWFSTPWIAGRRLGTGVSAYTSRSHNEPEELLQKPTGFSLSLSPTVGPELAFPLQIGFESIRTRRAREDPDGDLIYLEPRERTDDHRFVQVGVWSDTRGYRARARSGRLVAASMTQHGGILGGTLGFEHYRCDLLAVLGTGKTSAITAASRLVLSRGPVPRYQRLTLGGTQTQRGFRQGEFRGDSRWIGWIEQRIPLVPTQRSLILGGRYTVDLTLDGAVFLDAGSIWEDHELEGGKARMRLAGGAGLRLIAPLVEVLSLDVATDGKHLRVSAGSGVRL